MIEQVHPNFIQQVWPKVAPLLARPFNILGDEYYSLAQLKALISSGEQFLFIVSASGETLDGAFTIAIQQYPNKRVAFVTALGGRDVVTPDAFEELKAWAKSYGCTDIQGMVRESVARLMENRLHMKRKHIVMEFKL